MMTVLVLNEEKTIKSTSLFSDSGAEIWAQTALFHMILD